MKEGLRPQTQTKGSLHAHAILPAIWRSQLARSTVTPSCASGPGRLGVPST